MLHRAVIIITISVITLTALFFSPHAKLYADIDLAQNLAAKTVLRNGLTVILKEDHRTPTFAASLFIRAGSATEGRFTGSGITHLIEHMIFKGNSTQDAQEIASQIKSYGADIGAYTTYDYTAFKIEGPNDNIMPLLGIFYDIVSDPKFDNDEFEKEKNVIKQEMQFTQDNPAKYLSRRLWETAYLIHPYRNPIIGYEGIFDRLTPEDLKAYYAETYIPDKMVLVVVGDFDPGLVKNEIEKTFGSLPRKAFSIPALPQEPRQLTPRYKEAPYAISKSYMRIAFHSVDLRDPDLYALDTLAILLGEGNSSILYRNLRHRQNLVYDIGVGNYTPFYPGIFLISAAFDPANKDRVKEEILRDIEKLKTSPLKKKDLKKAKNQVLSSYIFSRQTQSSQADDLGASQLLTQDMDFSRRYVEGVSAVTPHDVMDAAKKYLRPESMTTVVLVPSAIKETEEKAKAHARTAQQRTVIKKTLRNGIRLLITEDKSLPLVSVRVCMMGGLRAEDKKDNGISNLTADMLLKGTSSHTEEQVYSMVESLGGAISTYSSNNTLGLSLDILAKDAKKGFILLGEVLSHPRFDKKKLRVLKERVLAEIGLLEDDIFASTEKRLRAKLFPNSPYGMISKGRRSSVEKITRRQIINFYRSHCVGSNIVVSICGDIDPKKAYKWMRSSLKGVRKKKPPRLKDVKLADIDGAVEVNKKMDKQQAVAMIGFRSAGIKDPSRYPLQILSSAFSGGAGRLYTSIRHKKGLSYTLGAFGMTGMDTGSFIFYAATAPPNIDIVKDEIIAQIKKVCDGGITQEEVDSAKKELIVKHEVALQTAGSFALRTALDELYGLGFDSYRHYPDKIKGLNLQEVIQAANRYFTLNSCVISITIPKNDD